MINVAGHNPGAREIEETVQIDSAEKRAALEAAALQDVDYALGAIGQPSRIYFIHALLKIHSGKMLRGSIQALAEPGRLNND